MMIKAIRKEAMHSKGFIHLLSMVKTLIGSELNQGFSIKSGIKEK